MKTIHDFIYRYDYVIKDYTSTMLCTSLGNVSVVLIEENAYYILGKPILTQRVKEKKGNIMCRKSHLYSGMETFLGA